MSSDRVWYTGREFLKLMKQEYKHMTYSCSKFEIHPICTKLTNMLLQHPKQNKKKTNGNLEEKGKYISVSHAWLRFFVHIFKLAMEAGNRLRIFDCSMRTTIIVLFPVLFQYHWGSEISTTNIVSEFFHISCPQKKKKERKEVDCKSKPRIEPISCWLYL